MTYANNNKTSFINFVHTLPLTIDSSLNIVYEAISEDALNWQDFIADEYVRLYNIAEINENPEDVLNLLDAFYIEDNKALSINKKMQTFLTGKLSSINPVIKSSALSQLPDWIDRSAGQNFQLIQAAHSLLKDNTYQIRHKAYRLLRMLGISPNEIDVPFGDKIQMCIKKLKIRLGLMKEPAYYKYLNKINNSL